jgi:hypothetical protein
MYVGPRWTGKPYRGGGGSEGNVGWRMYEYFTECKTRIQNTKEAPFSLFKRQTLLFDVTNCHGGHAKTQRRYKEDKKQGEQYKIGRVVNLKEMLCCGPVLYIETHFITSLPPFFTPLPSTVLL